MYVVSTRSIGDNGTVWISLQVETCHEEWILPPRCHFISLHMLDKLKLALFRSKRKYIFYTTEFILSVSLNANSISNTAFE